MIKQEKLSTVSKVRINDKRLMPSLAKCIDQIYLLSNSTLFFDIQEALDKFMIEYHKLPEAEQVRVLPDSVKLDIKALFLRLHKDAEYYAEYKSEERTKPAMLINSEEEGYKSVIDTDYFKEVKADVKLDFPYQSIAEIMKDKTLPTSEKSIMVSKYLEIKYAEGVKPKQESEKFTVVRDDDKSDTIELIKEYSMDDDDDDDIIHSDIPKTAKTPREMFENLCKKHPKQFVNADKGRGKRIGWLKTYRKRTYTPALITVNPYEFEEQKRIYEKDSTTYYLTDGYYIHGLDCIVYFIRITKEF